MILSPAGKSHLVPKEPEDARVPKQAEEAEAVPVPEQAERPESDPVPKQAGAEGLAASTGWPARAVTMTQGWQCPVG